AQSTSPGQVNPTSPTGEISKTKKKKPRPANETAMPSAPAVNETNAGKTKAAAPAKTVSESEIRAAQASGKVWVNTDTGVYHKSGRWFGATKQGKFMTEQEAMKSGYHAAKNERK